ncbi:nuclear transport factor 2 family protein [Dyadobacter sp. CY345]|uniref:nuclear transport factor 2 family protein n=1 Tax=Dyadobacter sp. CY345 TaxID=2909335 RepID=UPI001F328988|nr:nuclear transport factor 2 family protein [Dyadobacter sp. CY345]MCF2446993.1 nuclear transport factor 2 family protein [Dyadobacter sp. CY345]
MEEKMESYSENAAAVSFVLQNYFKGVYTGDIVLLRQVFHPAALVAGDIKGQPYFKSLAEYLYGVENRKSPFALKETFRMEIISIEIINSIAIAKVHLPMFEFNYYDLLSLTKVGGDWVIVNKLLTHVSV